MLSYAHADDAVTDTRYVTLLTTIILPPAQADMRASGDYVIRVGGAMRCCECR